MKKLHFSVSVINLFQVIATSLLMDFDILDRMWYRLSYLIFGWKGKKKTTFIRRMKFLYIFMYKRSYF